jgi:hypothetical protein
MPGHCLPIRPGRGSPQCVTPGLDRPWPPRPVNGCETRAPAGQARERGRSHVPGMSCHDRSPSGSGAQARGRTAERGDSTAPGFLPPSQGQQVAALLPGDGDRAAGEDRGHVVQCQAVLAAPGHMVQPPGLIAGQPVTGPDHRPYNRPPAPGSRPCHRPGPCVLLQGRQRGRRGGWQAIPGVCLASTGSLSRYPAPVSGSCRHRQHPGAAAAPVGLAATAPAGCRHAVTDGLRPLLHVARLLEADRSSPRRGLAHPGSPPRRCR